MPEIRTITLAPENLDLSVSLITDALGRLDASAGDGPSLALDMAGVTAPAAAALGKLVRLDARLRRMGGRLVLVNVSETAHEVFRVTRLVELLAVRRAGDTAGLAGVAA